jgi:hypothetical protein
MPGFFFDHLWPGPLVWALFYISDYTLTIMCARLYQAQKTIAFEGSYEITPIFQRDVNALRKISPRFVLILLLASSLLGILWVVSEQSTPEVYQFALGLLIGVQLAIHMRHLRNLALFRAIHSTGSVLGRIEYGRALLLRMSSWECFAFSALFAVLFVFTRSWFLLGGAIGCFSLGINHRKLAGKQQTTLATRTQPTT